MKLIARIKLEPPESGRMALLETLKAVNRARNWAADQERDLGLEQILDQTARHRRRQQLEYELSDRFSLNKRMAALALNSARARSGNRPDKAMEFGENEPIFYDDKLVTLKPDLKEVSIWTLHHSRSGMSYDCGENQTRLLKEASKVGQSTLVQFGADFYLFTEVEIDQPSAQDIEEVWR